MSLLKGSRLGSWILLEDESNFETVLVECVTCKRRDERKVSTLLTYRNSDRKYCNQCKHRKGTLAKNGIKKCTRCLEFKSTEEFEITNTTVDGFLSKCNRCYEDVRLRETFGISIEDYEEMFDSQHGRCAICGKHRNEFKRALAVDHKHDTGEVRGLLCFNCNTGLGKFVDDESNLRRALGYLRKFQTDGSPVKVKKTRTTGMQYDGLRLIKEVHASSKDI